MKSSPIARLLQRVARRKQKDQANKARAVAPDSGIGADTPIRAASADRLRRGQFADRIANLLSELSLREGRVFAIRGGWGYGKSSLKNLITEQLDNRKDGADWLDFNPWQWGTADVITRALFSQLANRLGGEHSRQAIARANALRRYGAILTGAGDPLKNASKSSHTIAALLTNASVIAMAAAIGWDLPTVAKVAGGVAFLSLVLPWTGRLLTHFGRDHSQDSLDKVRADLELRLRELDRPLVIFVDDIDRLEPEQIRTLLRQVKANANLPNIVFVLLFQPSIVERALDPVANEDGRAFLEKIVQASFDLPAVSLNVVHRIFGEELSVMAGPYATSANGFEQQHWGNAFVGSIQPYLRNMRDARRLLSSITAHMPLHLDAGVFEVNIVDFLLLETVRVFEPGLYVTLFNSQDLLLQTQRYDGDRQEDIQREEVKQLMSVVSEARREQAQTVIKMLFPALEWAFGGMYHSGSRKQWLNAKRACSARYFARYFELQTADGELSEQRFIAFLDATQSEAGLAAAIAAIDSDKLTHSLVARLDESVDRLPLENAAVLLPAMFTMAEKLAGRQGTNPFSSPWVFAWRAISWFIQRIPKDERGTLTVEALQASGALSLAAILIHLNDPEDHKDEKGENFDPSLELATVLELKQLWLVQMRKRAQDTQALSANFDLLNLLYRWQKYAGNAQEPHEWMAAAIRTDDGFAAMVERLMNRGTMHVSGNLVSTPYNYFDRNAIECFIGVNEALARLNGMDLTRFPAQREALETLKAAIESGWKRPRSGQ